MGRVPKSHLTLVTEGRSHRTKAELKVREEGEKAALTGVAMREYQTVKNDPMAHAVFKRVRKLLAGVGKADAIYEAVINRYCMLTSEAEKARLERERLVKMADMVDEWLKIGEIDAKEYVVRIEAIGAQLGGVENTLQRKRKMMLDIEKECMMTIAAALRAIPKQPDKDDDDDPMARMLARRIGSRE